MQLAVEQGGGLGLLVRPEAVRGEPSWAETRLLVDKLEGPTVLLSDHISNFLDVRGQIPDDKELMLQAIDEALEWPITAFRPATEHLVGMTL